MFIDVTGQAISDHYNNLPPARLWIHNRYGAKEEMPVSTYFRNDTEMPELEHMALQHCYGKILDVGAGAGSHALLLQYMGMAVDALDISPLSVQVMQMRGVRSALCSNIFEYQQADYDTLLLLMNGIGLTGNINQLKIFLQHATTLINPGGQLLLDSSDVAYLYEDKPRPADHYYGEIAYQYRYKSKKTEWFTWLYIDEHLLNTLATEQGWQMEVLYRDDYEQYLAKLTLK